MAIILGPSFAIRVGSIAAGLFLCGGAVNSASGQVFQTVGWDALMARLGAGNYPTGSGVVVAQVEASESPGNYGPFQGNAEFVGKTFTAQSGPPGSSGHATFVGQAYYGTASSISPGITSIHLYEAGNWMQTGYLRLGAGGANPPLVTPSGIKIFNHSWIHTFNSGPTDNEVLRRTDYAAGRDEVLMIAGMPNSASTATLMFSGYNGLSVGMTNGQHLSGLTSGSLDGPGRMKPDLVAPGQFTSFATPYVSGAAADLVQTARNATGLSTNANAQRIEVLKSVLLCGAQKSPTWTNNPATSGANRGVTATPYDPVYGAGTVNINISHLVLTGLEQNGSSTIPAAPNITYRGWDYTTNLGMVSNRYYRFTVSSFGSKVIAAATWNRYVEPNQSFALVPDFNLQLWKVNASNQLVSLVGSGGEGIFGGGNVVSQSTVDNVEHLFVTGLMPGDYVLNVSRNDAVNLFWDVSVAWLLPRPGDVNGNGVVNIDDLVAVITAWGACANPNNCPADQNGTGSVNIDDLVLVITNWG